MASPPRVVHVIASWSKCNWLRWTVNTCTPTLLRVSAAPIRCPKKVEEFKNLEKIVVNVTLASTAEAMA
eukprot:685879-Karenia_brevis.AAC.1